jgi:hypothetical protein
MESKYYNTGALLLLSQQVLQNSVPDSGYHEQRNQHVFTVGGQTSNVLRHHATYHSQAHMYIHKQDARTQKKYKKLHTHAHT